MSFLGVVEVGFLVIVGLVVVLCALLGFAALCTVAVDNWGKTLNIAKETTVAVILAAIGVGALYLIGSGFLWLFPSFASG